MIGRIFKLLLAFEAPKATFKKVQIKLEEGPGRPVGKNGYLQKSGYVLARQDDKDKVECNAFPPKAKQ